MLLLCVLFALFCGKSALAQGVRFGPDEEAGSTAEEAETLGETKSGGQAIRVAVQSVGVGGVSREGAWTGVLLEIEDLTDGEPRAVIVRMRQRDPDGDRADFQRRITLTPGLATPVWMYLPRSASGGRVTDWTLTVHGAGEGTLATDTTVGELLHTSQVVMTGQADAQSSMIGVIGGATAGLEQYMLQIPGRNDRASLTQGQWDVVSALEIGDLPDRWMGLAQYEVLFWSREDADGLSAAQASALREWVRRGGHLVVELPQLLGERWLEAGHPLSGVMPRAGVVRRDDRSLEPYRWLLTKPEWRDTPMGEGQSVYVFTTKPELRGGDWGGEVGVPLVAGPDGVVMLRRNAGAGVVTVLGIRVTDTRLRGLGVVRADVLWHRILGGRFRVPTPRELSDPQSVINLRGPSFGGRRVDGGIVGMIAQTGRAGAGVLLALVVFSAYWLLAGPVGFAVLKRRGMDRFAWLAFAGCAAVFTAVSWIGARAASPREVQGRHLTVLTAVSGEDTVSARTWASLLLPSYGDERIALGQPGTDDAFVQALSTWHDPAQDGSLISFPDARSYAVNSGSPERMRIPTRSTSKTITGDWAGGPRWAMPRPLDEGSSPRVVGSGLSRRLEGQLVHGMPGALKGVRIVVVGAMRSEADEIRRQVVTEGRDESPRREMWSWLTQEDWEPGAVLDLGAMDRTGNAPKYRFTDRTVFEAFLSSRSPRGSIAGSVGLGDGSNSFMDEDVNWFGLIPADAPSTGGIRAAPLQRLSTHGLDLSRFTTQPCVIVTGVVDGGEGPVPIVIDRGAAPEGSDPTGAGAAPGWREIPMEGMTIVRWVFPLPTTPERYEGVAIPPRLLEDLEAQTKKGGQG